MSPPLQSPRALAIRPELSVLIARKRRIIFPEGFFDWLMVERISLLVSSPLKHIIAQRHGLGRATETRT